MLSSLLDILLGLICLGCALSLLKDRNKAFISAGFLLTSIAALLGGLYFAGVQDITPIYEIMVSVARVFGMALIASGLLLMLFRIDVSQTNIVIVTTIFAPAISVLIQVYLGNKTIELLSLLFGGAAQVSIAYLGYMLLKDKDTNGVMFCVIALASFTTTGLFIDMFPDFDILTKADVSHVLLSAAYLFTFLAIKRFSSKT